MASPSTSLSRAMQSAATPPEAELLRRTLVQRERELIELQKHLAATDESALYRKAEELGVAAAVEASNLPPAAQRRVSVAIVREAERNGVDPMLVIAVIRAESSFNSFAVSHVGAMGLMQVMPDTGAWLMSRRGEKLGPSRNLFDQELNVELGTAYLAELIERFGSVDRALVAYNAGPSAAKKILAKPEVRKKFLEGYPAKVVREFRRLKAQQVARAEARLSEAAQPAAKVVGFPGSAR